MRQSSRSELMRKIQETCFACVDMNLYLDNHPDDKNAINTYNTLCNQFAQARYAYEYQCSMCLLYIFLINILFQNKKRLIQSLFYIPNKSFFILYTHLVNYSLILLNLSDSFLSLESTRLVYPFSYHGHPN